MHEIRKKKQIKRKKKIIVQESCQMFVILSILDSFRVCVNSERIL